MEGLLIDGRRQNRLNRMAALAAELRAQAKTGELARQLRLNGQDTPPGAFEPASAKPGLPPIQISQPPLPLAHASTEDDATYSKDLCATGWDLPPTFSELSDLVSVATRPTPLTEQESRLAAQRQKEGQDKGREIHSGLPSNDGKHKNAPTRTANDVLAVVIPFPGKEP